MNNQNQMNAMMMQQMMKNNGMMNMPNINETSANLNNNNMNNMMAAAGFNQNPMGQQNFPGTNMQGSMGQNDPNNQVKIHAYFNLPEKAFYYLLINFSKNFVERR